MIEANDPEAEDGRSQHFRPAETEEVGIRRHGKPAGIPFGFESEDDWFEYCLENDPTFLQRIAAARESLAAGDGVRLEDIEE